MNKHINKYTIFICFVTILCLLFPKNIIKNSTSNLATIIEIIILIVFAAHNKYYGLIICVMIIFIRSLNSVIEGLEDYNKKKYDKYHEMLNDKKKDTNEHLEKVMNEMKKDKIDDTDIKGFVNHVQIKKYLGDSDNYTPNIKDRIYDAIKSLIPKGVTGAQGEKGDTGKRGDTGKIGPVGPTGMVGPQGIQGEKGESGPQGIQGEKGESGPQGIQGEKGESGPQGEKGESGPQGIQGEKGDDGPQGPTGPVGLPVASGQSENYSNYSLY